jgi:hypothetical protein
MWASLVSDLRFAGRQLAKTPGLSAVMVASLALGVGANATVLCWMENTVRRPLLGVVRQEDLVVLVSNEGGGNVSLPDLRDFDRLESVFVGAQASQITPASPAVDDQREWVYGQVASANFFDLLGVKPLLGRTFRPDEDRKLGGDPVLVISESLWRRRFGADPEVVGRIVDLNRTASRSSAWSRRPSAAPGRVWPTSSGPPSRCAGKCGTKATSWTETLADGTTSRDCGPA